jgi:hypothetical protein
MTTASVVITLLSHGLYLKTTQNGAIQANPLKCDETGSNCKKSKKQPNRCVKYIDDAIDKLKKAILSIQQGEFEQAKDEIEESAFIIFQTLICLEKNPCTKKKISRIKCKNSRNTSKAKNSKKNKKQCKRTRSRRKRLC